MGKFKTLGLFKRGLCPFHLIEIFIVLFLGYAVMENRTKVWIAFAIATAVFVFVCPFIIMNLFNANVKNDTKDVIYAKKEEGDDVIPVQPGKVSEPIDGFIYKNVVYKLPGGCRAIVTEENGVQICSIPGWLAYNLFGRGFNGWNKLFCKVSDCSVEETK